MLEAKSDNEGHDESNTLKKTLRRLDWHRWKETI